MRDDWWQMMTFLDRPLSYRERVRLRWPYALVVCGALGMVELVVGGGLSSSLLARAVTVLPLAVFASVVAALVLGVVPSRRRVRS